MCVTERERERERETKKGSESESGHFSGGAIMIHKRKKRCLKIIGSLREMPPEGQLARQKLDGGCVSMYRGYHTMMYLYIVLAKTSCYYQTEIY